MNLFMHQFSFILNQIYIIQQKLTGYFVIIKSTCFLLNSLIITKNPISQDNKEAFIKNQQQKMQNEDNIDAATEARDDEKDYKTEHLKQQQVKHSINNDWGQTKFQKQLNMNITKADSDSAQDKQMKQKYEDTQKQNAKEIFFNDKNFVTAAGKEDKQSIGDQHNQIKQQQKIQKEEAKLQQEDDKENVENSSQIQPQQQIFKSEMKNPFSTQQCLQSLNSLTLYNSQPQTITKFSTDFKSQTIKLNQHFNQAQQEKYYYENCKIILTQPIKSTISEITFRLDNIKYCLGVGIGLKQILQKHQYDYKSTTSTELGHGLYIVTTQAYSWSHSEQQDDDAFREGFKNLYSGVNVKVKLEGENLSFKWKKKQFSMNLPSRIRQKYTLCFCAYLHQKTDAISIES